MIRRQELYFLVFVFTEALWIQQGLCGSGTDAKNLRKDLFLNYDAKVRPSNDQSDPVEVDVNFFLLAINELDEITETMKTTGFLGIFWKDYFLTWNPSSYGGIDEYYFPQGDVWKPDVALKNSYTEYKELGVSSLNVYVNASGIVAWYPFQVFVSTCSLSIKYFPFDTQQCELRFVAWSYSKVEVLMDSGDKGIVMDEYEPNSAWDVIDTSYKVDMEKYEAEVVFIIKLKRKPLYQLLSVIMPIIMLAVLNIFVFMLPSQCGEKASYAITVFLAFAVFLTIVASSFPENSEEVAVFSAYLIILTLQSTLITLLALISVRCASFSEDETPVPRCVQTFLRVITCRSCRSAVVKRTNKVADDDDRPDANRKVNGKTQFTRIRSPNAEDTAVEFTWKEVTNVMDRFLFVLFSLVLVTATMVFFLVTATHK